MDYVIPNTTYLEERKDKIRALIVTHGHLDHIGGVPLVLSRIGNPPVYSRNLSILLMRKRQAEFPHLPAMKEHVVEKDEKITVGKFKVRFFGVTHTVPDSMGIIIETPHGSIVTPGDYKLDQVDGIVTPQEEAEYAIFDKEKVLLPHDRLDQHRERGLCLAGNKSMQGLENLIKKITGRIIIAAFASHITRLAHVVKTAEALGKKVALDGALYEDQHRGGHRGRLREDQEGHHHPHRGSRQLSAEQGHRAHDRRPGRGIRRPQPRRQQVPHQILPAER